MLLGEYEHTIDDKNRLTLPARFREAFENGCVVTRGLDGCLHAWPQMAWQQLVDSRLASLGRTRRFASGTPIVRRGEAGSAFFVLLDGGARVVAPTGRPRKLGRGDFFGEMALLDESPRSADVVADGEVLALTISRSAFGKLLRSEPVLTHELLRTLAARLRAVERSPGS